MSAPPARPAQMNRPDASDASDGLWAGAPDASDASDGFLAGSRDLAGLLAAVQSFGDRFVAWPCREASVAWTLWVAHTHLLQHLDTTPRLAIVAPEKQSGKTRVLEVTESVVPHPLRSANTTTAVLFRLIGTEASPTVLLDEADAVWSEKGANEDLRALINAGHRRGSQVHRMTGEGSRMKATAFDTFAAVALAGIGDLPDTVMDRSVVIRMRRRSPNEQVERWSFRRGSQEGGLLREALAEWAAGLDELELPEDDDTLSDRAFDVWEPLLAIADLAGGPWPIAARDACRVLTAAAPTEVSLRVRLLGELRDVWPQGADFTATADLLALLHELEDSPWAPGGPYGERGLTAHSLARILGQYGVKSSHSLDKKHRGYLRAALVDPWTRYLPARNPSEASEASGQLLCIGCGGPMVEDFNGDGRHNGCAA